MIDDITAERDMGMKPSFEVRTGILRRCDWPKS